VNIQGLDQKLYYNAKLPNENDLPPPFFYFLSDSTLMFRISERGPECVCVKHNMEDMLRSFANGAPVQ
jgi:hypothetical protein